MKDIDKIIERSSLGTKSAQDARRTVSQVSAAKIVQRSAALAAEKRSRSVGGKR